MKDHQSFWQQFRAAHDAVAGQINYVPKVRENMPPRAVGRRKLNPLPRSNWIRGLAAAALVAGAALLWGSFSTSSRTPLTFTVGTERTEDGVPGSWIAAPATARLPLKFSDGTEISLESASRARVVDVAPQGAHLLVERGGIRADVVHRENNEWRVDVGPFRVDVVGTRFNVNWDPVNEIFRLDLAKGKVKVSGAFLKEPLFVTQGQSLSADCVAKRTELALTKPDAVQKRQSEARSGGSDRETPGGAAEPSSKPGVGLSRSRQLGPALAAESAAQKTWKELAREGQYKEAFELVNRGGFGAACERATAADLVLLGDVARLSGRTSHAKQAYLLARERSRSSMAAYGLGLTAFDQEKNYAAAAKWFQTYLSEQPGAALRREALGRLMEAFSRAGNAAGARQVAGKYLVQFPDGTHAPLARKLVQE